MKQFLLFALACVWCFDAFAGNLKEQERRANQFYGERSKELALIAKSDVRQTADGSQIDLILTLVNLSKRELTILTKNAQVSTDGQMYTMHFCVNYDEQMRQRRDTEKLTIEDLGPVTLRPGEVSRMIVPYPHPQMIPPNTKVGVLYRIERTFAERFGLWSGWTESIPTDPRHRTASTRR